MPDSNKIHELQERVANSRDLIKKQVTFVCRKYNSCPEVVKDLTSEIILFLLVEDCRHQKTYDPAKGKFPTWLRQVIRIHVVHHFQKKIHSETIDDISENQLRIAASQERELLMKERQALLHEAISQLTPHDQRIARFKLNDATDQEISQAIKITVRSLQREWLKIGKKIKTIFNTGGQKLCQSEGGRKIFLKLRLHFITKRL